MATARAPFATGIPLVNSDQRPPVPGGFVLQLADELTPTNIVNGVLNPTATSPDLVAYGQLLLQP